MNAGHYEFALEMADRVMAGRDLFTHVHQSRTAELSVALLERLGAGDDIKLFHAQGARIHDIGKIMLPMELLTKPGKISEHELRYLQSHVEYGMHLLEPIQLPVEVSEIVSMHHERLDGSGYPHGRRNGAIPMHARVIALADMVEAMLADRPYRPGMDIGKVTSIIHSQRDEKLDAELVAALDDVIETGSIEWLN